MTQQTLHVSSSKTYQRYSTGGGRITITGPDRDSVMAEAAASIASIDPWCSPGVHAGPAPSPDGTWWVAVGYYRLD